MMLVKAGGITDNLIPLPGISAENKIADTTM
jgi:hypothetical protein